MRTEHDNCIAEFIQSGDKTISKPLQKQKHLSELYPQRCFPVFINEGDYPSPSLCLMR
jgi:hypothetical protein